MQYRLSDIATIVGGELVGDDLLVNAVSTDSRSSLTSHNAIFVAMKGVNHDSHRYVNQMVSRGVRTFMVEQDVDCGCSYIKVENSIEALQRWAAHHRSTFKGCVVAITGSNGKTTVKEWFAQCVPSTIKIFRSPRSYNSQLGVALSLLMIEGDEDFAVIEAGVSQVGEMERLEQMIAPDVVVVTSIGDAHQEGFGSLEEKIEEKMILARGAATVIYHSDYKVLNDQLLFSNLRLSKDFIDSSEFEAAEFANPASRRNSQVVAAMCHTLGLPTPQFEGINPIAMRLEVIEGLGNSLIINDSYNSDLNSLEIALNELKRLSKGRECVVILSDILQSGIESEELYRKVGALLSRSGVSRVYGVGREIADSVELLGCATTLYPSTESLIATLTAEEYSQKAILLKGNRESHFESIAHMLARQSHTTVLEVDMGALTSNLTYLRSFLKDGCRVVAMIKAQSYGAGGVDMAYLFQQQGVDYLAVAFADEGSELRRGGITAPIIVLNADDGSFSQMIDQRLEPEIYSLRSLHSFAKAVEARGERDYPIHIKFDTGMHRLGFMEEHVTNLAEELRTLQGVVRVATIFSHLSSADMEEQGRAKTERQIELFDRMTAQLSHGLGYAPIRHLANSAGVVHYPEAHFDMVRLGIGLYGFEIEGVEPISRLVTRIVQLRHLSESERVGYGETWESGQESVIATIPIGYADGLDRRLGGGVWSVLVCGERAPIVGRVCMDSCMVDVTGIEGVEEGAEVVIFSSESGNRASDMSALLGTISYEVLTSVSSRVKRIYIE